MRASRGLKWKNKMYKLKRSINAFNNYNLKWRLGAQDVQELPLCSIPKARIPCNPAMIPHAKPKDLQSNNLTGDMTIAMTISSTVVTLTTTPTRIKIMSIMMSFTTIITMKAITIMMTITKTTAKRAVKILMTAVITM